MDLSRITTLIAMMTITLVTTAEYKVDLFVRTTSCTSTCTNEVVQHHTECLSSIKVNNEEKSPQQDGFNIVVFSSTTGKVTSRAHFRYFKGVAFWRRAKFKELFEGIASDSTVVVTFQNMCEDLDSNWFLSLVDLRHSVSRKDNCSQAIVIACKDTCAVTVNEKLPYTYYEKGKKFEKIITLLMTDSKNKGTTKTTSDTSKTDFFKIIGGIIGTVVFLMVIYGMALHCRHRKQRNNASTSQSHATANEKSENIYVENRNLTENHHKSGDHHKRSGDHHKRPPLLPPLLQTTDRQHFDNVEHIYDEPLSITEPMLTKQPSAPPLPCNVSAENNIHT